MHDENASRAELGQRRPGELLGQTLGDAAGPAHEFAPGHLQQLVQPFAQARLVPAGLREHPRVFGTDREDAVEGQQELGVVEGAQIDGEGARQGLRIAGELVDDAARSLGESVAPVVVAFVPRVDFADYGPNVKRFAEAVAEELIPMIEERVRTLPGGENRLMTGIASGGFASAYLALSRPETVGNVALQSFYFREEAEEELRGLIASGDRQSTRFWMEWSSFDLKGGDLDCEADSRELAKLLAGEGYDVATHESTDGAGWGMWRASTDRILERFFGN